MEHTRSTNPIAVVSHAWRRLPVMSPTSVLNGYLHLRRRDGESRWDGTPPPHSCVLLETVLEEAYSHGNSSKGAWLMSSSHAVHQALSVTYLAHDGLPSLMEIWSKFASKGRTA